MFTLSISKGTQVHLDALGLTYPFTKAELKEAFRSIIKLHHSDVTGDVNDDPKAAKLIKAYNALKPLSAEGDYLKDRTIDLNGSDLFSFTKPCPNCGGKGRTFRYKRVHEKCPDCIAHPYKNLRHTVVALKCFPCNGTGTFITKSGKKVICRKCKGNKIFYVKCRTCYGTGSIVKETESLVECKYCKGTGKVEDIPLNPVIPKGATLI